MIAGPNFDHTEVYEHKSHKNESLTLNEHDMRRILCVHFMSISHQCRQIF